LKLPAAGGGGSSIFKEEDNYIRSLTPGQAPGNALAVRFNGFHQGCFIIGISSFQCYNTGRSSPNSSIPLPATTLPSSGWGVPSFPNTGMNKSKQAHPGI
jgi:hypothetical protein